MTQASWWPSQDRQMRLTPPIASCRTGIWMHWRQARKKSWFRMLQMAKYAQASWWPSQDRQMRLTPPIASCRRIWMHWRQARKKSWFRMLQMAAIFNEARRRRPGQASSLTLKGRLQNKALLARRSRERLRQSKRSNNVFPRPYHYGRTCWRAM